MFNLIGFVTTVLCIVGALLETHSACLDDDSAHSCAGSGFSEKDDGDERHGERFRSSSRVSRRSICLVSHGLIGPVINGGIATFTSALALLLAQVNLSKPSDPCLLFFILCLALCFLILFFML